MKLDENHKKNIYKVPEGYFEKLPQQIQARIAEENKSTSWQPVLVLRYAVPVILLIAVAIYFGISYYPQAVVQPEDLLAEVSTQEIVDYLAESDITTEELIDEFRNDEEIILNENNGLDALELDLNEADFDELLNEYDTTQDLL